MLSLPPALFLVLLELTVGSFVSLYFLDVRGDTSRGFVLFQGVLYLIFAVLTLLAMNAFASPAIVQSAASMNPGSARRGRWWSPFCC